MADTLGFTTSEVPGRERFARYRDLYSAGADVTEDGEGFYAHVTGRRFDRMLVYDRRLNGVIHERLAPRVRRDGFEHFTVQLNRSGTFAADAADGVRSVAPGEIILFDMTKPMRTRIAEGHIVTLSVAREVIEAAAPSRADMHGLVLPARQAGLLADYMVSLTRHGPDLSAGAIPALTRVFGDLLSIALDTHSRGPTSAQASRVARVRSHIEARLGDRDLSPDTIAVGLGISRSVLYRDFAGFGGVANYVQGRRLARLRAALSRSDDPRSVTQLAYDFGFSNEAHCSRSFRTAFGLPPGRFRAESSRPAPDGSEGAKNLMSMWQREVA
jgi:AraC-like DNA-binding protein